MKGKRICHEFKKKPKFSQPVGDCESSGHPFESGVVVAVGVNSGGPIEDVKVIVGITGVVMKLGFEKMEKAIGCERIRKMGLYEVEEVVIVGIGRDGERRKWS